MCRHEYRPAKRITGEPALISKLQEAGIKGSTAIKPILVLSGEKWKSAVNRSRNQAFQILITPQITSWQVLPRCGIQWSAYFPDAENWSPIRILIGRLLLLKNTNACWPQSHLSNPNLRLYFLLFMWGSWNNTIINLYFNEPASPSKIVSVLFQPIH